MNNKFYMAIAAAIISTGAFAQSNETAHAPEKSICQKPEHVKMLRPRLTPTERANKQTERMTKYLNLTEEQQKQISKLNLNYAQKHEADMQKRQKAREKEMNRHKKEMDKNDAKLKKILTADQYSKMQQQREEMKNRHSQRPQHDNMNKRHYKNKHHTNRPANPQPLAGSDAADK